VESELPKSAWETRQRFCQQCRGWIVFGLSQNKKVFEISGVQNPEKIEQDFVTVLRSKNKFNVTITPECKKTEITGIIC
jgi:ATP-dependent DNA helicase RecG